MWNPVGPTTRSALALALAAGISLLGSAMMLKAGRALPFLTSGGKTDGQPGFMLLAVVVLLAVTGGLLLAIAAKELLGRRAPHPVRGAPRRRG